MDASKSTAPIRDIDTWEEYMTNGNRTRDNLTLKTGVKTVREPIPEWYFD